MRHASALPPFLLAAALLAACTPATIVPDQDRQRVSRELEGRRRWLQVALNVGPFFGDEKKALGSDQPFAEVDLLESPTGTPIAAPASDRILPPGLRVTLRDVEFPTAWSIARRPVFTPRYHAWAILEVPGEPRPVVLVLPQSVASFDDVQQELDRYLGTADPGPELLALPEPQRRAIARKEVLEGMGFQAATMAWGHPEKRIVDRPAGREQWIWPGGRRRAWFEEDRLVRFESRATAPSR